MDLLLLILPIVGLVTGSMADYGFIPGRLAFRLFVGSLSLFLFYCITDVSFSFEILDWSIIAIGLFTMGYGGGSRFKNGDGGIHKNVVSVLKATTILFYCSLPFVFAGEFFTAFSNDRFGRTIHTEKTDGYKIKHVCRNSNFTFPGYHYAEIYKIILLIEYPVDNFKLEKCGVYSFDAYVIGDYGRMTPLNKFEYDATNRSLILYRYQDDKYEKAKEFGRPPTN